MFQQFELAPDGRPWVHLIWAVPFVITLCAWGISRRSGKLEIFGYDRARSRPWLAALRRRRWRRAWVLALALLLLAAAAVQPRANPQRTTIKTSARDIVVLLDVSRSMLAEDVPPNRLERAKLELEDLVDRLSGDRIALIVFAGDAVIQCPLTSNYTYFKNTLRNVSTRSASQGGTRVGDAVRKALGDLLGLDTGKQSSDKDGVQPGETVLEDEMRGTKEVYADLLLITDGEDHDSFPVYAAKRAAQLNVGIYAVGLGSEEGSPISITTKNGKTELLRDRQDRIVKSRLDSKTLQDMVNTAPRGRYLPVGTNDFDLVDFYTKTLAAESGREVTEEQVVWTEIFQPFLIGGLLLYLVYLLLAERPRRGRLASTEETP